MRTITKNTQKKVSLEIMFMANEGFMISSGRRSVLIDTLFEGKGFPGMPSEEILQNLWAAKPPFDSVGLILTTHRHPDHFSAEITAGFLTQNENASLIGTWDTVADMAAFPHSFPGYKDRIIGCRSEWGSSVELTVNGVTVTILGLHHADEVNYDIPHHSYLIEFNGNKILHLGDALATMENFKNFDWLKEMSLDVAFLPEWYLRVPEGIEVIKKYIKADRHVLMHVPKGFETRLLNYARGRYDDPDKVVIFINPLEVKVFGQKHKIL